MLSGKQLSVCLKHIFSGGLEQSISIEIIIEILSRLTYAATIIQQNMLQFAANYRNLFLKLGCQDFFVRLFVHVFMGLI